MLDPIALPREIFDRARKFGIEAIVLNFQGGSDEGNLLINLKRKGNQPHKNFDTFESEIEDWAWSAYVYSGAGDGSDYGDDITYDLMNMEVDTAEWYYQRVEGDGASVALEIE